MAWKDKTGHRERLRHRFIEREDRALTDQALLELLLTYAVPRKDVQPIVKELINQLGSLSNVLSADIATLSSFKGVGEHSAILIKLIDWIRSRYAPQIRETTISLPNNKQGLLFNLSNLPQKQPPKRKERRTIPRRKALPTRETRLLSNAVLSLSFLNAADHTASAEQAATEATSTFNSTLDSKMEIFLNPAVRERLKQGTAESVITGLLKCGDIKELRTYLVDMSLKDPSTVDVINRYLKRVAIKTIKMTDFKPTLKTIEKEQIPDLAKEFQQYLENQINEIEAGKDSLPILKLE